MRRRDQLILLVLVALASIVRAQTPLLDLRFDNSLVGQAGETPLTGSGVTYEPGMVGQAAYFTLSSNVSYSAANNIAAQEGTLSFWIKPSWAGNNGEGHAILHWQPHGGGMVFVKDGANNLRAIFNMGSLGGLPEVDVSVNIASWQPSQWRHVAFTWSSTARRLRLYIDGTLRTERLLQNALPNVSATSFLLGKQASGPVNHVQAALDNLQIWGVERTAEQIAVTYTSALNITGVLASPADLELLPTWRQHISFLAQTPQGLLPIPSAAVQASTTNPAIALVEANPARVTAIGPGVASANFTIGSHTASVAVNVQAPVRQPEEETIDTFLATPAFGAKLPVPVMIIRYLPTLDGVTVNEPVAATGGTVLELRNRIHQMDIETKFKLEEGSKFRGYGDPGTDPSLGYRVVRIVNVFESIPPDTNPAHATSTPGLFLPDYESIVERFEGESWVNDRGVSEIWMWGYHTDQIGPWESNMSSPTTGDISNSARWQDDLPVYDRTYVMYNYNFNRSSNESVHNHGHQLEAILSYIATRQDGNAHLFWRHFVGQDGNNAFITGRCGWTHMPPNTTQHYNYISQDQVWSDIEDWTPAGTGIRKLVNVDTWSNIPYVWPNGNRPPDVREHHWYIYWMQSMPGFGNSIPHNLATGQMTNWWAATAQWDHEAARASPDYGLYTTRSANQFISHPQSQSIPPGTTAMFSVLLSGTCPPSFRWRRNGEQLFDGVLPGVGQVHGSETATLSIVGVGMFAPALYDCVVSNGCGVIESNAAQLTLQGTCPGDANGDGIVNFADLNVVLSGFGQSVAPGTGGDVTGDGNVNFADLNLVLSFFGEQC